MLGYHRCETIEPIRVSHTRIILKCAVCGHILVWPDRDPTTNKIFKIDGMMQVELSLDQEVIFPLNDIQISRIKRRIESLELKRIGSDRNTKYTFAPV